MWVSPLGAEPASRVVSINLCTDQLAMQLAPPEQLVSISYLAFEPMSSAMADVAQNYKMNRGQIEEIVLMKPDLVLGGSYTTPATIAMFDQFGIDYVLFPPISSIDDYVDQLQDIAELIGREPEAQAIIDDFQARRERLETQVNPDTTPPLAAVYGPNGYMSGTNTLDQSILEAAGLENLADRIGLDWGGFVGLETLIVHQPDLLMTAREWPGSSRAESKLGHPALAQLRSLWIDSEGSDTRWSCGSPYILDALEELVRLRQRILSDRDGI